LKVLVYETRQHKKNFFALTWAFNELGHEAQHFDWQNHLFISGGVSLFNKVRDRVFREWVARSVNGELTKKIRENEYDLMIVVRGDYISADTLKFAKSKIPSVVIWSSDDFSNPLNTSKCMLDCFPIYDCIFSPRKHLFNEYLSKGAKSVELIDCYYRPGLQYTPDEIEIDRHEHNISFIGSWSKNREQMLTPINDMDLNIWGWGWGEKTEKFFRNNVKNHPPLTMENMMEKFSTSKINVNILTKENRDRTNFRNFEIPAAGGFQISERTEEIQNLFEENKEIVLFSSAEELKSKCDFYLMKEATRKQIAINGYRRLVGGNHSILDRAQQMIKFINRN
jgi:spore maturation protein CgeB